MTVNWGTLIADREGVIDLKKVGSFVAILLALVGAVPLFLSMLGITFGPRTGDMTLGVAVLVTPLTAGRVTDAIRAFKGIQHEPDVP
jgi:hypothetical protein